MHQSQRSMLIPDRQRRKLQSALEQYAPLHTKCRIPYGIPLPVQCTFPKGKMILNCNRSKTTDIFISPARQPRDSESSSDNTSIWSHPASIMSRPSGFWSSNASTRSSNESSNSTTNDKHNNNIPQYPGSAMLSTSAGNYAASTSASSSPQMSPIRTVASIQSIQSSMSTSSLRSSPKPPPPQQKQRVSMPTPIINAASPGTSLEHQHSYRKANHRRSEPPPKASINNGELDVSL